MSKRFDLEERTFAFARHVREFIRMGPKGPLYDGYVSQALRSSSSVGANYIEANEALSRKDFYLRIKIAKKEARETLYWLQHIEHDNKSPTQLQIDYLYKENQELINIFGSILKTQIQSVRKIGI